MFTDLERAKNLLLERGHLAEKISQSGFSVFRICMSQADHDTADPIFLSAKSDFERISAIEKEIGQILKIEMSTYSLKGDYLLFVKADNAFLFKKIKNQMKQNHGEKFYEQSK